jgi:hypothetical protein
MDASRIRLAMAVIGLFVAGEASAGGLAAASSPVLAALLAQTASVTVYSKVTGGGAVGIVQLAPAIDVAPVGPGPEDLPASAPTSPAIACRTDAVANCVGSAAVGSTVILQPFDVANATFLGWSGCTSVTPAGPGHLPRCNLAMAGARTVSATFKPTTYTLAVKTYPVPTATFTPAYGGRLQAATAPPIDCRTGSATWTACSAPVSNGASVTVTALPDANSRVASWSGCTPTGATTCTAGPMTVARTVSATFGAAHVVVTGQVAGAGAIVAPAGGSVVDGMACPTDCSAAVVSGGSITLTATPEAGNELVGWTGCASTTDSCTLAGVTAAVTVAATFRSATCTACHGLPPGPPHVERTDCETCHPGFTSRTVDPAVHMNGVVDPRHATPAAGACSGAEPQIASCATCHPCQGE